jgi:hypothetical protein
MISPLLQRQSHLASNMEGLRQAHDVAEVQQRELTRKQAAEDRLAESRSEVPQIPEAQGMRTEERKGQHGGGQGQPGSREGSEEADAPDTAGQAESAEKHLDFLA